MAPDDRTPRQEAIALILAAERPHELFPILGANAVARDPALVAELEGTAADLERFGQPGAAAHVRHIARVMRGTFERLDELTRVESREALLVLLRDSTIAWSPRFYDLVEVLAKEADASDAERARLLRRGLAVKREMEAGLEALHHILRNPKTTFEALQSSTILRDPLFHEYVLLFVRNNIEDPEQAEGWRRAVGGLVESCRVLAELEAESTNRPITFDEAAAWHRLTLPHEFDEVMSIAASTIAQGQVAVQDVMDRFIALVTTTPNEPERVMLATVFLENACRTEPGSAPLFLKEMRRVVGTDTQYPERVRAANALHYAMSLLLRWRAMPNPAEVLADAERLLAEVIPDVDPAGRGARLARDLHWNRGQLLQNLGTWDASRFADAVAEFRIALDAPPRLRHEHVAKALILSDLANALQQLHLHLGTVTREVEEERSTLYSEALQLLNAETEPLRRSTILGNVAIFLNEREGGDLGLNQERALEYVLEAIRLLESLQEEDNPIVRAYRAGLERTRGNILFSRLYGDPYEMAKAAIAAYDTALAHTATSEDWLRGTIQYNRANAYARLAAIDPQYAQKAYYIYEEARSLLSDDRLTAARALAGQASVMATCRYRTSSTAIET